VCLDTTTFVLPTYIIYALSILVWFGFQAAYSALEVTPDMYWVGIRLFGIPTYWLQILLLPILCNLPEIVIK